MTSLPPMPSNYKGFKTGAPAGFQTLKSPSRQVAAKAKDLLKNELGQEFKFNLEGVDYFARLEPHYHPPGYVGGPNGWHKGVSVYVSKNPATPSNNAPVNPIVPDVTKLPAVPEKAPKKDFLAELNKIIKSLMG